MSEVSIDVEVVFNKSENAKIIYDALNDFSPDLYESNKFVNQITAFKEVGVDASDVFTQDASKCEINDVKLTEDNTVTFFFWGGVFTGSRVWQMLFNSLRKCDIELIVGAGFNDQVGEWGIYCSNGETDLLYETGFGGDVDRELYASMNEDNTLEIAKKLYLEGRLVMPSFEEEE